MDNRVEVPLELEDSVLFDLMLEAHKRDLTLNQFVEVILKEMIERHEMEKQNAQSNPE